MALTVLLVSACTSAPDVPQPRAFDDHVPDARLVLIAGFAGIHDKYIDDVSLRDLATESIRGLAAIDPALTIDRSNGQLILKRHGDKIASADLPESEDPTEWGDMAVKLTREASVYSRDLRQASTEAPARHPPAMASARCIKRRSRLPSTRPRLRRSAKAPLTRSAAVPPVEGSPR